MSVDHRGQLRRSQVITTYGPGALIDLPLHSALIAGLQTWPKRSELNEVLEPRLTSKVRMMTDVTYPRFYEPPPESAFAWDKPRGIGAYRFPEWFVVQEKATKDGKERSRRLVHRRALDARGMYDKCKVVATRFVRACPHGHVDDLDWQVYVHGLEKHCGRQLWLDEKGTSGDLADLVVRCECGKTRSLYEAAQIENNPLGSCSGARPWLGRHAREDCPVPSRLLIRTASNAYFPQIVSVLSIPERANEIGKAVQDLWDEMQIVQAPEELAFIMRKPKVAERLGRFDPADIYKAITETKQGRGEDKPLKLVELDALIGAPEGFGDDTPIDPNFHARRLPSAVWRKSTRTDNIEAVIQLHRLREVLALIGFSRFEAITPDIHGEYDSDVERADLDESPEWFPAVENRGEGVFFLLSSRAVSEWLARPAVSERVHMIEEGHRKWSEKRRTTRPFPGGAYIMLHTLSHLMLQSLSMRCGYPASSIRERVYVDVSANRYGVLLYTGTPDAEGTLGGLVQQGRHLEEHLLHALRQSSLCSNDPICAHHNPGLGMEGRLLHGAACHGCTLIAETSCEMHNDFLDRALVVPILGNEDCAFFPSAE